jgi:hypothetical protein
MGPIVLGQVAHFFREVILLNTEMRDDSNLDGRDVFLAPTRPPAGLPAWGGDLTMRSAYRGDFGAVAMDRPRAPVPASRRVFLKSSASVLATVAMPAIARVALARDESAACETTSHQLPVPNFRLRMNNIAGLRPHRKDCYRLEAEEVGDKFIVHNYGVTAAPASP